MQLTRALSLALLAVPLGVPRVASAAPAAAATSAIAVEKPPTPTEAATLRKRVEAARKLLGGGARGRGAALALPSLQQEASRLEALLRAKKPTCNPELEVRRLERDAAALAAGQPFHEAPGVHRLSYRSPLDGAQHGFLVVVPEGYSSSRRWPLVVMLHGMSSPPLRDLGRLFGLADRETRESRIVCDRPQLTGARALVVAPEGFGDALFRVLGEVDVTSVVRLVTRSYAVDPSRVTITGLSMGGTGAAEVAFQHPDMYAGVLALCGYYDRKQDSSVQGEPLLPWEQHLMSVHSPVEWSVNGRGLPLHLVHGEQDGPGRARRLQQRYQEHGYPVELELYPRGHDVWVPGYEKLRAFKLLGKLARGGPPKLVTFATGRPRVARAYWVRIDRFADQMKWARVRAEVVDRTHLKVSTENVARLHLDPPATHLAKGKALRVAIDGAELELSAKERRRGLDLARVKGGWQARASGEDDEDDGLRKRTGLSGPMEDLYYEPLVVVYGTGRGQAGRLLAVAQQLARYRKRVSVSYKVIPDRQWTPRAARRSAVILVGNEANNSALARLGAQLPIRVLASEVLLGGKRFTGPGLGATFIYPNPEARGRYLRVVGGTSERSYKLFEMLPVYQPDYLVFDEGVATKHPKPVLGKGRSLLAGGSFDERWQLSRPPLAVPARGAASRPAGEPARTKGDQGGK